MSSGEKFVQLLICVAVFFGVVALILLMTSKLRSRSGERIQFVAFVLPAVALIALGLLYPAVNTIYSSFKNNTGSEFVGLDNYHTVFTDTQQLRVLRNTALWVALVPTLATFIGLVYAVLVDRSRFEKFAKALIFLPMAISLVGASIIWKFVYDYKDKTNDQIGLANQILKSLGFDTYQFLLTEPWNNLFLIVIMIWVQAGFAMTLLSASIKAIPEDIVEAARLDGVGGLRDVPLHHDPEHPAVPDRGPHHDQHHHAQGLRHRAHRNGRQLRHQRAGLRVLRAELPLQQRRARRGARHADLRAGATDRRLQRPSVAKAGVPDDHRRPRRLRREPSSPRRPPPRPPRRRCRPRGPPSLAVVIAVLWTLPTAGLLISSFRPEDDVKIDGLVDRAHGPVHPRELPARC